MMSVNKVDVKYYALKYGIGIYILYCIQVKKLCKTRQQKNRLSNRIRISMFEVQNCLLLLSLLFFV